MEKNSPVLYVVVPCFNEEAVVRDTAEELETILAAMVKEGQIGPESKAVFVDDGSQDGTWKQIRTYSENHPYIGGISLSRNTGHQNALYAGLMEVKEDCQITISMDADLQDDPALIPAMVAQYGKGSEIVYAIRKSRKGESVWKRASAFLFYRFVQVIGVDMPKDCGDFRLLGKKALEELSQFPERNPFLRGLVPLLGLPSSTVFFDRRPRRAGKSKYSLTGMVKLAINAVLSFSSWPVFMLLWLGAGIFAAVCFWWVWRLFLAKALSGWEVMIGSVWAAAGLILMGMGIVGLYLVRIWQEQSGRPRYRVKEKIRC